MKSSVEKEKCPVCGGRLQYYHTPESTRAVCRGKCPEWTVIKEWSAKERFKNGTKE